MNTSKIYSLGLAASMLLCFSTRDVAAHNSAKYTNVPFVVAAACSPGSSKIVSTNGTAVIQAAINSSSNSGFEVYCSAPGTGTLPATATGLFPQGTLTFSVSGLPADGTITALGLVGILVPVTTPDGTVYKLEEEQVVLPVSISNGIVSIPAFKSGDSTARIIDIQVHLETTSSTATVAMSNFRYSNSPLLVDTTVSDVNNTSGNDYCSR